MSTQSILVVGSSNTDMVIRTEHLPAPGETVIGGTFLMNPGGKGANQAVAAARLGGRIAFICKTGDDLFGRQTRALFNEEGIDTAHLFTDPQRPSGVALITVDAQAENCIVVAPGANAGLSPADIRLSAEAFDAAALVLLQLEIPMETVEEAAFAAHAKGKTVVLNPAPASVLSDRLLRAVDLLTPNASEAEAITGITIADEASALAAAKQLVGRGVGNVIVTLGASGALVYDGYAHEMVPACKVQAADTTAAGDIFNGALAVALSEGRTLVEAARFAAKASAIAVTRIGAQSSAPYRTEVEQFRT